MTSRQKEYHNKKLRIFRLKNLRYQAKKDPQEVPFLGIIQKINY